MGPPSILELGIIAVIAAVGIPELVIGFLTVIILGLV